MSVWALLIILYSYYQQFSEACGCGIISFCGNNSRNMACVQLIWHHTKYDLETSECKVILCLQIWRNVSRNLWLQNLKHSDETKENILNIWNVCLEKVEKYWVDTLGKIWRSTKNNRGTEIHIEMSPSQECVPHRTHFEKVLLVYTTLLKGKLRYEKLCSACTEEESAYRRFEINNQILF